MIASLPGLEGYLAKRIAKRAERIYGRAKCTAGMAGLDTTRSTGHGRHLPTHRIHSTAFRRLRSKIHASRQRRGHTWGLRTVFRNTVLRTLGLPSATWRKGGLATQLPFARVKRGWREVCLPGVTGGRSYMRSRMAYLHAGHPSMTGCGKPLTRGQRPGSRCRLSHPRCMLQPRRNPCHIRPLVI